MALVAAARTPLAVFAQIAEPATEPAINELNISERAELNLMRRLNLRQNDEIARLKSDIAALTQQIRDLGQTPVASTATSQPSDATTDAHRIIFIRINGSRQTYELILAAVDQLNPDQYFNVLTSGLGQTLLFEPKLVPGTEFYKKKVKTYLNPGEPVMETWLDALTAAVKWRPDVVWLIGQPHVFDEEQDIREMKKRLAGSSTRINTSIAFSTFSTPETDHLAWRIAHETGGICLDKEGQPIQEPAVPVRPVNVTPPPATAPRLPPRHSSGE